ncbi:MULTISPECIES: hypothetical protein [unclassified Streptomyces]|uniref:hypothetical protein n=1 Tax=unclassified Streptomyces TaxID=2593676 RepID=UPI000D0E96CB|nr:MULTISPECIES: hypothetical protein [unclassified Streptomyces]MYT30272.1 hypothetical protein [Streptomyces sp. SID8354]
MTYSKAAAVVAGAVMALGVAAPAFADGHRGVAADAKNLIDSSPIAKNVVKKPPVNVGAVVNAVAKTADRLKSPQGATKSALGKSSLGKGAHSHH